MFTYLLDLHAAMGKVGHSGNGCGALGDLRHVAKTTTLQGLGVGRGQCCSDDLGTS
jgi:hypothetical protein